MRTGGNPLQKGDGIYLSAVVKIDSCLRRNDVTLRDRAVIKKQVSL